MITNTPPPGCPGSCRSFSPARKTRHVVMGVLFVLLGFALPAFAGGGYDCPVNPGVIGNDQTICAGTAPSTIVSVVDASEPGAITGTIFYRWENSTDAGANWAVIPGANSSTFSPLPLSHETWYRRRAYVVDASINILCPGLYSNIVKIGIAADAVGGLVTADQTICTGSQPADLVLTGNTGAVLKWQSSPDIAFTTSTDIPVASTTLTGAAIGNLTTTTFFRAVVDNGACPAVYSGSNSKIISETFDSWVDPPANTTYGGVPNFGNVTASGGSILVNGYGGYSLTQVPQGSVLDFTANFDGTAGSMFTNIGLSSTTDFNSPFAAIGRGFNPPDGHVYARVDVGSGPTQVDLGAIAGQFHAFRIVWGSTGFDFYVDGVLAATIPGVINGTLYQNFFDYISDTHVLAIDEITVTTPSYTRITVSPTTVGGIVNATQTICSGTAPANLQLVAQVGSILRWQSSTDAAFTTPVDIANTTATLTSAQAGTLTADTWFRGVVQSGACPVNTSTPVHIIVGPPTVGGVASADQTLCNGSPASDITLSGHTGTVLRWQRSGDAAFTTPFDIANTTTTLTAAEIGTPAADEWFRAVVQNGTCPPAFSTPVHLTVTTLNPGLVSPDGNVCPGANTGSVNLSGNNGTVQKWQSSTDGGVTWTDIVSTSTTYSFSNLTQTTQFRAEVGNGTCPVAYSGVATISMNPVPLVVTTDQTASGAPQTADLTAAIVTAGSDPGLSFTYWNDAGATNALATPAAATPGDYFIKGTNGSGCSDIKPVKVIGMSAPTLVVNDPAAVCAPATVDITAPAITNGSTAGLVFTYWQDAATTIAFATPTNATTGTYYIKGTDGAGQQVVQPVRVLVKQPSSSTTAVAICAKDAPYAWNGNNYSTSGTYTATLTNAVGCDSVATLNLTVNAATSSTVRITIADTQLPYSWNGNPYTAAGTYTSTTLNAVGCDSVVTLVLTVLPPATSTTDAAVCPVAYPYSWNGNSYATPGTYTVTLRAADGRDSIATLHLTTLAVPMMSVSGPAPICEGRTADLTLRLQGTAPFTVTYDDGTGVRTVSGIPGAVYTLGVTPSTTTTYRFLSVEDAHCRNDAVNASVTVNVIPAQPGVRLPTVNAIANIPRRLQARSLGGNYSYTWMPGNNLSSTTAVDPVFTSSFDQEYRILMSNNSGCGTTDTLLVRATDLNTPGHDPDIIVPTAFTPNGDGRNDLLTPIPINLDRIVSFRVFNRWGNVVFEANTAGKGWDGVYKNLPAPTETFTWTAEGVDRNGKTVRKHGVVTLIR